MVPGLTLKRQIMLESPRLIAIDSEFMRKNTYWPILSLVQYNAYDKVHVIDALAHNFDLEALKQLLSLDCPYVLHAARQDLEIFYHLFNFIPKTIVDTQLAASFAGLGENISYQSLVEQLLGITLDKAMQQTDWNQRPLTDQQLAYAKSDVVDLPKVHDLLMETLDRKGYLSWFKEDSKTLYPESIFTVDVTKIWKKAQLKKNLKNQSLGVLQDLCAWREKKAMTLDYNRTRVIKDEVLEAIALALPQSMADLNEITTHYTDELWPVLEVSYKRPEDSWPTTKRPPKPTDEQQKKLDILRKKCDELSVQLELPTSLLSTQSELKRLIMKFDGKNESFQCLNGWRYDVLGRHLLALL